MCTRVLRARRPLNSPFGWLLTRAVFRSGSVAGALASLLGTDYTINNHRHMHVSTTESEQTVRSAGGTHSSFAFP